MFKIIRLRKLWYIISLTLVAMSVVSLFVFGLRVGIDYKGGTIITYETAQIGATEIIESKLNDLAINSYQVKASSDNQIIVKTPQLEANQHQDLNQKITLDVPDIKELKYDSIGPSIGQDLRNKSIIAISLASLAIIIFIAFAFRKVPKPLKSWKFGFLAVIALLHDLLITTGMVSLLGHFFVWLEVDALFITALLTVMGFSVHDTIVIYDRLRENFIKNPHKKIETVAEESVNQTLARSINTSLTTIIVLTALMLLGGTSIRHFILVLLIGIFIGTYSSIFVAAPLLVSWHKDKRN